MTHPQSHEARLIAARRFIEADALLTQAMRDGLNVHGAMSAMGAAEDELRDAMREVPAGVGVDAAPEQDDEIPAPLLREFRESDERNAGVGASFASVKAKLESEPPTGGDAYHPLYSMAQIEAAFGVMALPRLTQDQLDARIKELMAQAGFPNSLTLYQAFKQLAQELTTDAKG